VSHSPEGRDSTTSLARHSVRLRDLRARFGDPDSFAAECSCGWRGMEHTGGLARKHAKADGIEHEGGRAVRPRMRPGRAPKPT
jgi:hypothetical protein